MAEIPKHGRITLSVDPNGSMKRHHLKAHLDMMTRHAGIMADYHGPNMVSSDTGQSSRGGFTGSGMTGGAGGADYMTTATGNTDTEAEGH